MQAPDCPSIAGDPTLDRLRGTLAELAPELRRAAVWLLEHPDAASVGTIRQLAQAAAVKPNALVRLAHSLGLKGFGALRDAFRAGYLSRRAAFPDRARWLQSLAHEGHTGTLYGRLAETSIANIEEMFTDIEAGRLRAAAAAILGADRTYVLGLGVANPVAQNFAYVAGMAIDDVTALPHGGALPVDGLARATRDDILVAMTFRPFRREVIEAVGLAQRRSMQLIAISDSLACPILARAAHAFVLPTRSPQFFTSTVSLTAFFEALTTFMIAQAGDEVVANIRTFHQRRHELGIYVAADPGDGP